ncbi:LLM class F420-dependent oxidoreductase [Mycobacterium sp. E1747]|uniref:LLM class F420-dependent oxidoreductase n=1 Tax=Mycobacterium sp. E1747 TaxID=1834128 RepID=UPI0009ED1558|nr:LLM class F420-dependent oxidoreductase [Mycobacterium sp. E1747]
MYVDANIGGAVDGTAGANLEVLAEQVAAAESMGFDGVWSTEVSRDPFLPLMIAADRSSTLRLGTAVAVAFARSPMTMATVANDLNTFSRGRFVLGLGSQIQAHIERRFSMPWSAPAERMREYIAALQSIWRCWYGGDELDFRGTHYQHTLMTPMFRPQPSPFGPPSVVVAAVGPRMTTVAAEVADGLLVHGFTTARYLREVTLPLINKGLMVSGRTRTQFTTTYPGLVATGANEKSLVVAIHRVRDQIAFYGATPAYRTVLDLHGWGDLHLELHQLSRSGRWKEMAQLVDDDVLHTFAVVGEPATVGAEIDRRFGGLIDRFTVYTPYPLSGETLADLVRAIKEAG